MQNQDYPRQSPHKSGQTGNALWFILVAIALLAALTLTLTRNSSKMSSNLGDEKTRVVAEQVLRSFNSTRDGVERLINVNGCSESEISFEYTGTVGTTYANSNSSTDKRCWLYNKAGAGLTPSDMPTGVKVAGGPWIFTGSNAVSGVGPESATETTCSAKCAELMILASGVTKEFCTQYNLLVNVASGAIPNASNAPSTTVFTGTFDEGTTASHLIKTGSGDKTTGLYNVKTACVGVGGLSPTYHLYYVLLQR